MVTEWIVKVFADVVSLLLSGLPVVPVPSAVQPGGLVAQQISEWGSFASRLGLWFPWSVLFAALGFVLACVAAAVVVKVVRILASFATAGGGSAA